MNSEPISTTESGQEAVDWVRIQAELAIPFTKDDIEWRIGRCGQNSRGVWATALAYVTNRAIMDRLDDVVGAGCWHNEFSPIFDSQKLIGYECGLTIFGVTKWDAAAVTNIEAIKGGHSDSMKRAAVHWGIGRYLYGVEEGWCECSLDKVNGWRFANAKEGKHPSFYWTPPALPAWALPAAQQSSNDTINVILDGLARQSSEVELTAYFKRHEASINASARRPEILRAFGARKAEIVGGAQ